jgi:hypothetical protein
MSLLTFLIAANLAQPAPVSVEQPAPSPASVEDSAQPQLLKPAAALARACAKPGSVCAFAGGNDTYGDEHEVSPEVSIIVLKRSVRIASMVAAAPPANQPWQVEIVGRFKATTAATPIKVVLLDKHDPDAVDEKRAIATWDVRTPPTKLVAMQLDLRPEDGFVAGHRYLCLLVQTGRAGKSILAHGYINLE